MNGAMALAYLADVKPFKTSWRIQVKILHTWKQYTKQAGETFEMVLADQRGTKIHASIKKALVNRFENRCTKGEWRVIENFSLTQARGQYRVTNHPFKMGFVNTTSVTPCNNISDDVYLTLPTFQSIIVGDLNPFFFIDVLGQIICVGTLDNVEAGNKPTKKLEFQLRNERDDRLPCTLWGKYAEQVFEACIDAGDQMVICLIRFAKINTFRGENQITNGFDASDVIINPDYPEVDEFVTSLPKDGLAVTISESKQGLELVVHSDEFFNQYPQKSIEDLLESTEVGKCKIMCTIFSIDTDMGWFYVGCKKCSKKVESNNRDTSVLAKTKKPTFWCPKCSLNITQVVPRFKLHVRVMDNSRDTKCILFDTAATEIIGQSANLLLNGVYDDDMQDPEKLPLAIKNLVGKTFQLLICVENDNLSGANDTYRVGKIWPGTDVEKIDDLNDSEGTTIPSQITSGCQEMYMLTNSSEASNLSGSDANTPSSKRTKDEELDGSSTSKKICLKAIKLEKLEKNNVKLEKVQELKPNSQDPKGVETNETKVSPNVD